MHGPNILRISLACLCLAVLASAQNNYVDDYDFDAPPPRAAHRPSQASYSRPSSASTAPRPTPVAILKQIDRHNEDGSYTYGYEGGDGSFKIETKLVTGEVMGKYGYVDDNGKVRVVEYGANRYGFQPAGEGITVAPPTLVDETATKKGGRPGDVFIDDGAYYPPEEQNLPPQRPAPRPAPRPRPQPRPQPQPLPHYEQEYVPAPAPRRPSSSGPAPPRPVIPGAAPAPVFSPAPVYEDAPQHRSFSAPQRAPQPQRSFSAPQPQIASRPEPRFEALPPPPPQRSLPPPQQVNRAQHARTSGGILDQLERDYALPQSSSAATHDISFSSF